jgi:hypothetical protein
LHRSNESQNIYKKEDLRKGRKNSTRYTKSLPCSRNRANIFSGAVPISLSPYPCQFRHHVRPPMYIYGYVPGRCSMRKLHRLIRNRSPSSCLRSVPSDHQRCAPECLMRSSTPRIIWAQRKPLPISHRPQKKMLRKAAPSPS